MDSVSQFALGAAVSVAALGHRTPIWKAALWGGLAGTLPDLDVFIDHGDDLRNMTMHRGNSHALLWLTLAAPVLAALPAWLHRQREHYGRWWLAMWLALFTHPLLDTMTVYGTRLLLPFSDHPFAVGSMFIIDPLYTVPLLAGLALALARGRPRGLRANAWGLVLSTAYLAWSVGAQWHARDIAQQALAAQGDGRAALLVTPTAFNTVLWRIVAMRPDGSYQEGFYSLFDGARLPRMRHHAAAPPGLRETIGALPPVRQLAHFSQGFYKLHERDGRAWISDLRMGQEPNYIFSFAVAQREGGAWRAVTPANFGTRGDARRGLAWLWQRLQGIDLPPPG